MANKFCIYCGAPLTENARFCIHCGKPVPAEAAAPAQQPAVPQPAPLQQTAPAPQPAPVQQAYAAPQAAPVQQTYAAPQPAPVQQTYAAPQPAPVQQPYAAPQPAPVQQTYAAPQPAPVQQTYAAPQPAPVQQQRKPQKAAPKKSGGKTAVSVICLVLAAAILFTGFVAPGFALKKDGSPLFGSGSSGLPDLKGGGKKETIEATAEQMTVETNSGVRVELSPFLFDYDEALPVSVRAAGVETAENGDYQITAYDIDVGDLRELDTYIDIRLPYDGSFCDAGEDPAKCVAAKYYNETSGEWEDVLFDVDAEAKEVVIHTDHLSRYGCFEVRNAGLRNVYITNVDSIYLGDVPLDEAAAVLSDCAKNGINCTSATLMGLFVYNKVIKSVVEDVTNATSDALDIVANTYSGLQLNDIQFFTEAYNDTNSKLNDTLTCLGFIVSGAKLGMEIGKSDKTSEDVLTIYKDAGMFAMNVAANTVLQGLGPYMTGIWLIDKSITDLGKAARNIRMENWESIYEYYNDKWQDPVHQGAHRARTSAEWRDVVSKCARASHGDKETFQYLLETQVDAYARRFFLNEPEDDIEEIQHIVGHMWRGALSASEKEDIITRYKQHLYQRLTSAILKELQNDYERRLEAALLEQMQAVKADLNRSTSVHIFEKLEEGQEATLGGYILRFNQLSKDANVKYWTGTLKEDGTVDTTMTMIGWLIAGHPDRIDFWPPGKNPDTDKPEFSVPFKFNIPNVSVPVEVGIFPTFEEVLGFYENGILTVTDVYIPPELKEALESDKEDGDDDGEGCDLNIDLESLVGQTKEAPFTLEETGEKTFRLTGDGGLSDILDIPMVYNEKTGTCPEGSTVYAEDDESWSISMSMECSYSDEQKSGVIVSFDIKMVCEAPTGFAGVAVYIKMSGEKALEPHAS